MKEQTWRQWIREIEREKKIDPGHPSSLTNGCLAALTGTDVRVLDAFVPTLKLYAYTEDRELLKVAGILLLHMQEHLRFVARELIPFVLDWGDRERLWPHIVGADLRAVR